MRKRGGRKEQGAKVEKAFADWKAGLISSREAAELIHDPDNPFDYSVEEWEERLERAKRGQQ